VAAKPLYRDHGYIGGASTHAERLLTLLE